MHRPIAATPHPSLSTRPSLLNQELNTESIAENPSQLKLRKPNSSSSANTREAHETIRTTQRQRPEKPQQPAVETHVNQTSKRQIINNSHIPLQARKAIHSWPNNRIHLTSVWNYQPRTPADRPCHQMVVGS